MPWGRIGLIMKFEKITDNKLKVVFTKEDMDSHNVSKETFLSDCSEFQDIFQNLLQEAERQVDFKANDCKLIFEALMANDDGFIFTITKIFSDIDIFNILSSPIILKLDDLNDFLNLFTYINNMNNLSFDVNSCTFSLYLYDKNYYLYIENQEGFFQESLIYTFMEFGELVPFSVQFIGSLNEYGKSIGKFSPASFSSV